METDHYEHDIHNYKKIDRDIHSAVRLNILTILAKETKANFVYLKTRIGSSDGNLSLSLKKLAETHYITETKKIHKKKTLSTYQLTEFGKKKYEDYLLHLRRLLTGLEKK